MSSFALSSSSPRNAIFTSALVMMCCCQPLGVASVVFSVLALVAENDGNSARSRQYLAFADGLNAAGLILFIAAMLLMLVMNVLTQIS